MLDKSLRLVPVAHSVLSSVKNVNTLHTVREQARFLVRIPRIDLGSDGIDGQGLLVSSPHFGSSPRVLRHAREGDVELFNFKLSWRERSKCSSYSWRDKKKVGCICDNFRNALCYFWLETKSGKFWLGSSTRIGLMHDYVTFPKFTTKPRLHLIILIL